MKYDSVNNQIKSKEICDRLNQYPSMPCKIDAPRLRKIINYIRANSIMPIIATSNGYYFSVNKIEIQTQIKSLRQRISGILQAANGMENFLNLSSQEINQRFEKY
jgi:hypothetical protein